MSHLLHQTDGLIIGERASGEADLSFQIFSARLGLITAHARGARQPRSKLRPHLTPWSHTCLTLVRGREVWRLIGAERTTRLDALSHDQAKLAVWARVAGLLRRLIRGEEPNPDAFADLLAGLSALSAAADASAIWTGELCLVLRLLSRLGYVQPTPTIAPWLAADFWQVPLPDLPPVNAQQIVTLINHGLHESQL